MVQQQSMSYGNYNGSDKAKKAAAMTI